MRINAIKLALFSIVMSNFFLACGESIQAPMESSESEKQLIGVISDDGRRINSNNTSLEKIKGGGYI